ncbi:MAG: phosphoribosylformylglycinamidine cyclo-ligase [Solobacterium sp.]|jgi:phosphoribosylformylglycinamidine cyclo-ligase|nr:phosphoribosylformylglycinamidine cyclo-ligase [Solobacterium sp.]MCH4222053.1 phosphoribosylformylglycinamidine cyclo-ligase [Solobacterium sp.]MCH4265715.1 phosphoribosylformylglycinamidine cyclo-ligase [Solobacterium sp.]
MEKSYSASYAAAGVDITAGYKAVELMKQYVNRTMNEHCIGGLGGFGGLFELDCTDMPHPVLISGTDGVGTKLRIAHFMDRHDTVGIDCVAMCVNDVICAGAKPLFFLDYIACGKNVPERIADLVKGVAGGCVQADCALVGGETAEMPGFYPEDEYDLAGFTVGAVDKSKILDNSSMQKGDVIIALPSSGVHSNGFSLVRRVFDLENHPEVLKEYHDELGCTLGEALLAPTVIYVKPVLAVMKEIKVKGVSHITGGGFFENIPRSLKKGCSAVIEKKDVRTPALFNLIAETGNIPERDMFNTYNMGVGMIMTVAAEDADNTIAILKQNGQDAYRLGVIGEGEGVDLR